MKNIFKKLLLFIIILNVSHLYAQGSAPVTDSTPKKCKWDLRSRIYTDIDTSAPIVYGKINANPMFYDPSYSNEGDGCFKVNACLANDTSVLKYTVYYPINHDYISLPLPCIIFFHPGGFSDCTTDTSGNLVRTIATEFAHRGFIFISVEYRRGRKKDKNNDYRSVQTVQAQYIASQHARGAFRTIIKKQRNFGVNEPFQIDTNYMFIGGASSGGVICNSAAYFRTDAMVYSSFPTLAGQPAIQDVLGPINVNYYLGGTDIDYRSKIKGVINLWSGATIPISYYPGNGYDFFATGATGTDNPPYIGFHGYDDEVFPLLEDGKQLIYFSPPPNLGKPDYNSTNSCLIDNAPGPLQLDDIAASPDVLQISSLKLFNIMNSLGKLAELYIDYRMKHGVADGDNFGTSATTKEDTWLYIVQRTATFLQAVMNNATPATLGNNLFIECENTRIKCNNPNPSCSNTLEDCIIP